VGARGQKAFFQRTKSALFCDEKCPVNTKLTSNVPFFCNFDVFKTFGQKRALSV
jgi:hypothetical protein